MAQKRAGSAAIIGARSGTEPLVVERRLGEAEASSAETYAVARRRFLDGRAIGPNALQGQAAKARGNQTAGHLHDRQCAVANRDAEDREAAIGRMLGSQYEVVLEVHRPDERKQRLEARRGVLEDNLRVPVVEHDPQPGRAHGRHHPQQFIAGEFLMILEHDVDAQPRRVRHGCFQIDDGSLHHFGGRAAMAGKCPDVARPQVARHSQHPPHVERMAETTRTQPLDIPARSRFPVINPPNVAWHVSLPHLVQLQASIFAGWQFIQLINRSSHCCPVN